MKSFKQYLEEMPNLISSVPPIKDRDESDLNMTLEQKLGVNYKKARKISTHNNHHIYKYSSDHDSTMYFAVHPETKRIKAQLVGGQSGNTFDVRWAGKHSSYEGKVRDLYKHFAKEHQLTLRSDLEHSPGTMATYKSISDDPEFEIKRISISSGKELQLHTGDNFSKNYSRKEPESRFIVRYKN